jgi:hypothetical protein
MNGPVTGRWRGRTLALAACSQKTNAHTRPAVTNPAADAATGDAAASVRATAIDGVRSPLNLVCLDFHKQPVDIIKQMAR